MNIVLLNKMFNRAKPKEIIDLEKAIERKASLDKEIQYLNSRVKLLQNEIESKSNRLEEINDELNIGENRIVAEDLGIHFEPVNKNIKSIENDIDNTKTKLAKMLKEKSYCTLNRQYIVDRSERKGKELVKAFCENNILGFNLYCEKKRKAVTQANYNTTINLIDKAFWRYSKRAEVVAAEFNESYLDLTKELCKLELSLKIKKQQDKDRIKEEKRKLREEQKILAEAEKAKAELQKQRRMYEQSLTKALTEQERKDFENKLKEIDKREADVDYRINNARAGYLYIAATKSMPNTCKLGVTRRLNPLVRIQELSSASVAYPFVCYGLVFDDDVFDLETRVHEYFDDKRVNKENRHKEFFYITPQEAIDVLQNKFNCEVHFVDMNEQEDNDETN